MRYTSTRDSSVSVDGGFAVAVGVPSGGGLFAPEALPELNIKSLSGLDFAERCEKVLCAFLGDIAVGVSEAVRRDFDEEQMPVVKLDDDLFVLEQWHGKTCTAPDIARTVREYVSSRARGINGGGDVDNSSAGAVAVECVAAQVACWVSAYCDLADSGEIEYGDKIDVVLPITYDGGFVAAWYAQNMGVPIGKIVCASAKSRVLHDFVYVGTFAVNASSADEDMRIAPELERIIFSLGGNDAESTAARMKELEGSGMFSLSNHEAIRFRGDVACEYVEREHADEATEYVFDEYGYLIDPVTAWAFAVESERDGVRATLVAAVAHPYTSPKEVLLSLGENPKGTYKDMLDALEDISATEIPEQLKHKIQ